MSEKFSKIEHYVIASDTGARDGIGVEIYVGNNMVMEIFRDDTKKKREVSLFQDQPDLELVEQAINLFKEEIPEDFQVPQSPYS